SFTVAKEYNDIAVVKIGARIKRKRRIRTETCIVGSIKRRRQRQVDRPPACPSIRGEISSHRQGEGLVGARRERSDLLRVEGDESFTLGATFVRHVHVVIDAQGTR